MRTFRNREYITLVVAMLVQTFFQTLLRNETIMRQTIHYFQHSNIHRTDVENFFMELVLLNNILF